MNRLFAFLLCVAAVYAADVVPTNRQIDWSVAGVEGGIPNRTSISTTLATSSTFSQINSAISSAAANTVVSLAPGMFTLSGSINIARDNVTLRGSGSGIVGKSSSSVTVGSGSKSFATATNLPFTTAHTVRAISRTSVSTWMQGTVTSYSGGTLTLNVTSTGGSGTNAAWYLVRADWTTLCFTGHTTAGYISMQDQNFSDPNTTAPPIIKNITAGLSQGSTALTLNNVTSLAVGDMVMVDQLEDVTLGASGYVNADGGDGYEDYGGRQLGTRSQLQIVKITNIAGSVVTISPGLYMPNWSSTWTPQLWKEGNEIEMSGIEDLVLLNIGGTQQYNMFVSNAMNCWIKNVSGMDSEVNQVRTYLTSHIEVRHCYFNGTRSQFSQSYGVSAYWSSNLRCEDNIFDHVTSPMLNGAASAGCVFFANFAQNQDYSVATWLIEGTGTHGGHSQYYLFEANWIPDLYIDFIHGSGSHHLTARNRILGWDGGEETNNLYPIAIQSWNRYMTIAGNILGTTGTHDRYEWAQPFSIGQTGAGPGGAATSIYVVGYFSTSGFYPNNGSGGQIYDSTTYTTLIRKGNYNTFTASIPSSPVDETLGSDTIATSYLYAAKPAYFGNLGWPAFSSSNPSAASIDDIPAGYRFLNNGSDPPTGINIDIGTLNVENLRIGP